MCSSRRLIVMGVPSDSGRNPIGWRTESNRAADGNRSGGGRKPIGRRTESNRAADGNRSGGGRKPIGRRTESDRVADGNRLGGGCLQGGALVSSAPTKLSSVQQSYQVFNKAVKCTKFLSVVNILAWLVHFLLWQAAKPSGDKCTP